MSKSFLVDSLLMSPGPPAWHRLPPFLPPELYRAPFPSHRPVPSEYQVIHRKKDKSFDREKSSDNNQRAFRSDQHIISTMPGNHSQRSGTEMKLPAKQKKTRLEISQNMLHMVENNRNWQVITGDMDVWVRPRNWIARNEIKLKKNSKVQIENDTPAKLCTINPCQMWRHNKQKHLYFRIAHHDNARPHTAHSLLAILGKNNTPLLPQPPYSPDLAPNDFPPFILN
ncbi:hypothetical protein LAZ67_1003422 [Cordylochernes scorpioides]|uniref:Uncharacterized protein n=1 Tax=Cordylochernes scorpioides TaxID=51811 RepID=A0ABY6JZS3_9ARAC|nr:hypothetical protein LAZ67_1003422 [Cordylochernes scorpioides]